MNVKSILAAALLAATSLYSQAVTVHLEPVGGLQVGQSFDLQLRLDSPFEGLRADEELLSFGFRLDFDSALLKLDSFTPATGWDDDSGFLGAGQFGASIFPGLANAGQASVVLATLHFDVLGAGPAAVHLSSDAGNLNHGINYLWTNPLTLDAAVTLPLSAVPEPSAFLLMAFGISALLSRRKTG